MEEGVREKDVARRATGGVLARMEILSFPQLCHCHHPSYDEL